MGKQKSDIVRDKIIKAREAGKKTIVLTDDEACDLWSALLSVEWDVSTLKTEIDQVLENRFQRLGKSLEVSKAQIKHSITKSGRSLTIFQQS